ncbi:MAG: hypothetical protein D4R44_06925 [Actinobacteria bacterium]|nr:MAG: hypothetical protein D4R44_06925 [Actinomycetota bacterium]
MTRVEFNQGWCLLLLQPWAHRYKAITEFGELSTDAKGQAQFYFDNVQGASGAEWVRVCREYAKGTEWPSLDALKRSLSSVSNRRTQLELPCTPPLTLDEFGRDLYDAIRLQSAQVQQESNAAHYDKQPGFAKFAVQARQAAEKLREELTEIFQRDTLTPDELRRVLTIGS